MATAWGRQPELSVRSRFLTHISDRVAQIERSAPGGNDEPTGDGKGHGKKHHNKHDKERSKHRPDPWVCSNQSWRF